MTFDLERFVQAQAGVHEVALAELRAGRKTSHWMWFVFPQVAGLGRSAMAHRYALASLAEARAYLEHPVLGPRLRACAAALLEHADLTADAILGGVDAMKLRSAMTLFHRAAPSEGAFKDVLDRFYGGLPDPDTDALLAAGGHG